MSKVMIGVCITKELRALLEAEAKADQRTISQIGKLALIDYLKKKGRLKKEYDDIYPSQ